MATIKDLFAKVMASRPVRVLQHYSASRGPILSAGLSYQAIFAVFAAIWVGFSVAGLVLQANVELRDAFLTLLNSSVPGLIASDGGEGIIDPEQLLESQALTWSGIIALGGLLFTALGWLASCRDAVRTIFGLPGELTNFVLLKLKDIGLGLAFGVALLLSSALLVFSTQALGAAMDFVGLDRDSAASLLVGRVVGLALMFALDTVVLAALFRALSGLTIPLRRLLVGALLGAAGLGLLKVLGTALLGGATRNPLLASFAVILGLLIWFNLICQVILVAASWISVGMSDVGLIADPRVEQARREKEQRAAEQEAAIREEAAKRAAAVKRERRWGWLKRMFGHGDKTSADDAKTAGRDVGDRR
ncbi:membrane protein [Homoserinimonas aerilata]|uniref:Membrane protein n=1 Tax=Homoserinimonas aerilata TaxID=1162970 RepID=A0A542YKU7_9MICO|nr:YihY/virulence factor BrkB family protein [Homoserinimonas aerilata]TQL48708.1 membrane protein [Homoserinimonas aerilata]